MKTTKLIYPLILALACALATTGCKHKPVGVTKLPGGRAPQISESTAPTTPGGVYDQGQPVKTGGGDTAEIDETGYIRDPKALEAYTIHFAYDSSVIRNTEKPNLAVVAQTLSSDASTKLVIEGNCDERGTEEYNRSLGERRALAGREALAKLGVDPMRIITRSFGKDKPVDPGHDESAWAKNRRDDFVLLHPKAGS